MATVIGLNTSASGTVTLAGAHLINSLHAYETSRSAIHGGAQCPNSTGR